MNVKEEQICRLCLKVAKKDFQLTDEVTTHMFVVLMLKVNLDVSKDPVVCKDCSEALKKCYNFKSVCFNTEEIISSFAMDKNGTTFQLQEVFKDGKDVDIADDNFICRFCSFRSSRSNFVLLDTLKKDGIFAKMLQALMPEMDYDIIKNPVICVRCIQDLDCYIKFAKSCMNVEAKIIKYSQNQGTPSSTQVKLSEVLQNGNLLHPKRKRSSKKKYSRNIVETAYTQMHEIKQEEALEEARSEAYKDEITRVEEAMDTKVNFYETASEASSDVPVHELNTSSEKHLKLRKAPIASTQNGSSLPTTKQSNMVYSETGSAKDRYYTLEEKIQIVTWRLAGNSIEQTVGKFMAAFKDRPVPESSTVSRIFRTFRETGCLNTTHKKKLNHPHTHRMGEEKEMEKTMVLARVRQDPAISTRRLAKEFDVSQARILSILKKHKYRSYKVGANFVWKTTSER